MNLERANDAALCIGELILEGASTVEVISTALRFLRDWQTDADFEEAVALLQFGLQNVVEDLQEHLPMVEKMEREGVPVTLSVNDDTPTSGFNAPTPGMVANVQKAMATYREVIEAIQAELPPTSCH